MGFDRVNLKSEVRCLELCTINSIAKYLRNFNDSLLVESELDLDEMQVLARIFVRIK